MSGPPIDLPHPAFNFKGHRLMDREWLEGELAFLHSHNDAGQATIFDGGPLYSQRISRIIRAWSSLDPDAGMVLRAWAATDIGLFTVGVSPMYFPWQGNSVEVRRTRVPMRKTVVLQDSLNRDSLPDVAESMVPMDLRVPAATAENLLAGAKACGATAA